MRLGKDGKIRLLFMPFVDRENTNAQSLTVREIVPRFDPARFECTLWYEKEPDPRVVNRPGIRVLRLSPRRRTWRIFAEMLSGHDVIAFMDYSPASYLFLHLPVWMRRKTKAVLHAEAPAAQMVNPSAMLKFLHKGTYPNCDFYTGITEYVAKDVENHVGKRAICLLPTGVDTNLFTPPEKRMNQDPVVLFAGTVIERKGPLHVLEAAERFPRVQFRLAGAGRNGFEKVVQDRIAHKKLTNVKLEGSKSQPELRDIMRGSDIFLLPSRLEGMPKVTLEAAASGLPCIVFRDYETPSVVDQVTGFQVGTLEEMMEALAKLIDDAALRERMGAAARGHVQQFDWNAVCRQWQDAYLEIAAAPRQ